MHKAAIQQNSSQFIRIIPNFDTELTTQPLALGVPSQNPLIMSGTFANNKGLISRKPLMMSLSLLQRNWVRFALHPFKTGWHPIAGGQLDRIKIGSASHYSVIYMIIKEKLVHLLRNDRDSLDFHQRTARQPDLYQRSRRRVFHVQILGADLPQFRSLRKIRHKIIDLDHILKAGARHSQTALQILERIFDLRAEIERQLTVGARSAPARDENHFAWRRSDHMRVPGRFLTVHVQKLFRHLFCRHSQDTRENQHGTRQRPSCCSAHRGRIS